MTDTTRYATPPDFPRKPWYDRLAGYLERDDDFRRHGAFFTGRIAFRCDQEIVTLAFERGLVLEVAAGDLDYDYLVTGTRAQWDHLYQIGWGLVRLYRSGTLTVRGDAVRIMQNWKALFFIVEAMRGFFRQPA